MASAHSNACPSSPREEVCDVSLVVREHADFGAERSDLAMKCKQSGGVLPRGIEAFRINSHHSDARRADLVERSGHRARQHCDLKLWQMSTEPLHDRQEDHIVAQLVHLEDQESHIRHFRRAA